MQVSIVLPIHNEQDNVEPVIDEIFTQLKAHNIPAEVIAIDDGSTDDSLARLKALLPRYQDLRVFSFRRNLGQAAAFDAGFRLAIAPVIVTMDADGQNDPADIPKLLKHIQEGYDLVTGMRAKRKDGLFLRKIPSHIANGIIRIVTRTKATDLGCSLKAYRREITEDLMLYGEMHRFVSILGEMQGARLFEVDVNHRPRTRGESKYGLMRTFKVIFDLMTVWFFMNYQTKPSYVFGGLSLFSLTASGGLSLYVMYEKYFEGNFVHKNPLFIIAIVLFMIGIQFIVFGFLAEVLVRTYYESQSKRPYSFKYVSDGRN